MAALTAQGCRLLAVAALDATDSPNRNAQSEDTTFLEIAQVVSVETGAPIKGDIEATNLQSTAIEMVDDLVEEMSYPVTVQCDMTIEAHQNLLVWQTPKTKVWFAVEIPESATAWTRLLINGWIRNYRYTATPRAVQQASFDILTRAVVTIAHGEGKLTT